MEETEVDTNVPLLLTFPLDVLVGNLCRTVAGTQSGLHGRKRRTPLVTTDARVTSLTPTNTQLTIRQPLANSLFYEFLVRETPAGSKRVETGPALVGTEVRATIVTIGISSIVAVVVAVGPASEERSHRTAAETCANLRCTSTQSGIVYSVRGQTGIVNRNIVVLRLPALLTNHGRSRVLAEGAAVGQIVLQLPESTGVLLHTALVARTLPSAEVNHRFVGFTLVPT